VRVECADPRAGLQIPLRVAVMICATRVDKQTHTERQTAFDQLYAITLGPSNDFTLLNGCTAKCVRLSRLLAFECTLNHCTFISFHFILA